METEIESRNFAVVVRGGKDDRVEIVLTALQDATIAIWTPRGSGIARSLKRGEKISFYDTTVTVKAE